MRATAIAINPEAVIEDVVFGAVDHAVYNVLITLVSLVPLVVRLIINGRVAVGGFARD